LLSVQQDVALIYGSLSESNFIKKGTKFTKNGLIASEQPSAIAPRVKIEVSFYFQLSVPIFYSILL
jgi:hypothetical protein